MRIKDGDEEQSETNVTAVTPAPAPSSPEPPFTIFDRRQQWLIIAIVSTAATFSGFASNIYFPALPTIADNLNVSLELINLTVTSYLIFQGIAPSFWGPVSDVRGRRIAYAFTFVVFLGACIGLAEAKNYATLIVLRCLQSTGSASTIAIGSGVVGDITTRADRGGFMGIFQAGLLVPVAVGPVIGGALAGTLGWRSIFWFLAIYSGSFLIVLLIFLPETLRSVVGNGSRVPSNFVAKFPLSTYAKLTQVEWDPETSPSDLAPRKRIDVTGPFRILVSKQAAPIVVFLAVYYAVWQMSITAMSSLFKDKYGLSEIHIGLTFIANGVGSMVGTLIAGRIMNLDYRNIKRKLDLRAAATLESGQGNSARTEETEFPLEKARFRLVPIYSCLQCLSIILFGWTINFTVHIAVPIISTFITGWTVISMQTIISTYLVDIFPSEVPQLVPVSTSPDVWAGATFTICAGVQLLALIGPLTQWKYGATWRKEMENQKSQAASSA
ncbi:hypothetical protein N7468_008365 [Penicillium chermesinum]|uniref:Major facilitator superfamily (MFS) profile domain-containing protein n=1 Tax=Penicillium chermesinum TaxID=63820 RepID=A0A9W9NRW3_9EURO|nr:uncharacterized protein N7468_008365 [Penicillium chermesinum]KAJ5223823.1 hypothetical protein N7468_008365 [Penicillium chermesinum]